LRSPSHKERWVCRPEPWTPGERLGHEAGVDALLAGHLLHHQADRHEGVGHGERIGCSAGRSRVGWARPRAGRARPGCPSPRAVSTERRRRSLGKVGDGEVEVGAGVDGLGDRGRVRVGEVEVTRPRGGEEGVAGPARPLEGTRRVWRGQPSKGVPSRLNTCTPPGRPLPPPCSREGPGTCARRGGPGRQPPAPG